MVGESVVRWSVVLIKPVVERLPSQIQTIDRPERVLVSRKIFFKKVTTMPFPKLKLCKQNIPISEVDINCMPLPRAADTNGLTVIKFKRIAEYLVNVLFERVRSNFVGSFLRFLKQRKHL